MRFLPVFLDLSQGVVGLLGDGPGARNKLRLLQSAGARVRWYVAEAAVEEEARDAERRQTKIRFEDPDQADFSDLVAVVSSFGDERDDAAAQHARRHHIPINVVDRPDLSTFIFPAIVDRGDVVVAIGTGGASPVLARRLRERIEALLPARIGDLASLMGRFRTTLAKTRPSVAARRRFWERVIDGPIGATALAGRWRDAEAALARACEHPDEVGGRRGTVFLVGAGPGDPDLLTLRALRALQDADVVYYDEFAAREILDRARRDAERIFVGKRAGRAAVAQDAIHQSLAAAAQRGLNIVRLSGGDPVSNVRAAAEREYLHRAGVGVVIVPRVTAAPDHNSDTEMAA
jgi:uroporphyrin-III C-methyltransferase / precorrin-2 dehydrogenase / sirohydrochlorin ferrochelatase